MHGTATDNLRALVQRFTDEVLNAHDTGAAMNEFVAEEFIEQNPLPGQGPGRAGLADVPGSMFTAFPDLRWMVRETIAEDDQIMTLGTCMT